MAKEEELKELVGGYVRLILIPTEDYHYLIYQRSKYFIIIKNLNKAEQGRTMLLLNQASGKLTFYHYIAVHSSCLKRGVPERTQKKK